MKHRLKGITKKSFYLMQVLQKCSNVMTLMPEMLLYIIETY